MAAHNERFGASGAVTRLKVCADLQVYRPSERQWKPRLRKAARRCMPLIDNNIENGTDYK